MSIPVALAPLDLVILGVSFLLVIGIAVFASRKRKGAETSEDFFLSGRDVAWWATGASLFAANIGSEHYIAQAGSACATGIAVGLYEWTAAYLLLLLGWAFAPVYLSSALTTIPELFERRFNKTARMILAVASTLSYIVTKISATLYASAIFLNVLLGWNMSTSVPIIIVVTGLYTIIGGLSAVIYTDVLQVVIALAGGLTGMGICLSRVGGWPGIKRTLIEAHLPEFTHAVRPPWDKEYAITGMLIGQPIASIWYWCLDQEMAQRVLCAKNLRHAKGGVLLAGFLKILPVFVIMMPGLAARVMFERCRLGQGFAAWCETNLDDPSESNKAYPYIIMKEFPTGVVGVMVAAMIAAMMGALSAVFNSASTVFTMDIYRLCINPHASNARLVIIGRLATCVMVLLSILWIPVIEHQHGQLYLITQNVMTHVAPPLSVVFILGLLWWRVNGHGAVAGMAAGITLGLVQYCVSLARADECAALTTDSFSFVCMHFNHFAIIIAVLVAIVTLTVSLCTPAPDRSKVEACTFWVACRLSNDASGSSPADPIDDKASPQQHQPSKRVKGGVSYMRATNIEDEEALPSMHAAANAGANGLAADDDSIATVHQSGSPAVYSELLCDGGKKLLPPPTDADRPRTANSDTALLGNGKAHEFVPIRITNGHAAVGPPDSGWSLSSVWARHVDTFVNVGAVILAATITGLIVAFR